MYSDGAHVYTLAWGSAERRRGAQEPALPTSHCPPPCRRPLRPVPLWVWVYVHSLPQGSFMHKELFFAIGGKSIVGFFFNVSQHLL